MKFAILADIHSNYFALNKVIENTKKHKIDKFLIAGDLIGYYFWPCEVFQILASLDFVSVKGNHEEMFIKSIVNDKLLKKNESKYGSGIRVAKNELNKDQINFIKDMKTELILEYDNKKILICHGSPWDKNFYIYPDSEDKIFYKCASLGYDIIILGHTHYPMIKRYNNTIIINPGSVGQPRNNIKKSHWALLNTETNNVENFIVSYDNEYVFNEAIKRHPELPYLSNVLIKR